MSSARVLATAKTLEIDIYREPQFAWIAELGSGCQLPNDWKEFQDDDGELAYYHPRLRLLTKVHPVLSRFKRLYKKQSEFAKVHNRPVGEIGMEKTVLQIAVILNEALNRSHKELPPATPEIVETLSVLLNIDTSTEYYLTALVKSTLELYVEKQYELAVRVELVADPAEFLKQIRAEQVRLEVTECREDVVTCQECEIRSAKIKCAPCKDFFCRECFGETHATGKRKTHATNTVEQCVCGICDKRLATSVVCAGTVDAKFFCDSCYTITANETPDLRKLPKKILMGLICYECGGTDASIVCEDCVDLFCSECFVKIHRKGKRIFHVPILIDDRGEVWRAGVPVPPEDAQSMIDKAKQTAEGGHWLAFKDDQLNTYWYHLRDKVVTVKSPYV